MASIGLLQGFLLGADQINPIANIGYGFANLRARLGDPPAGNDRHRSAICRTNIELAGVNRAAHRDDRRPLALKALQGFLTAMSGALVDDPEHASGRAVRFVSHPLGHDSVRGSNSGLGFTTSKRPPRLGPLPIDSGGCGGSGLGPTGPLLSTEQ